MSVFASVLLLYNVGIVLICFNGVSKIPQCAVQVCSCFVGPIVFRQRTGNCTRSAVLSILCSTTLSEPRLCRIDSAGKGRYELSESMAGYRCKFYDNFCFRGFFYRRQE